MPVSLLAAPQDWPPENEAFPIREIDIRVRDEDPLGLERYEAAVSANWEREKAANPHLFNGRLVTLNQVHLCDGAVRATGQIVPYAYHLWWRRQAEKPPTFHSFGMPVIQSADDAIIAIRMSRTTANAGKVYCASGSLEEDDIVDGRIDLDANMEREVAEETGLKLADMEAAPGYFCAWWGQIVMFYRFFRSPLGADALLASVHDHMRRDTEKEIDAVLAITGDNRDDFDYAHSMPPALDLVFGRRG
ncbi:NUDIX hydrolase [Martelella radicis]|uniref:8-oxo-dGTP pyrophosphatase MutT (NUDIX family) n=1 Tax=Martelella radicis TaxID=1397476 RepID=A0A7W6KG43_9HYPH|nr:NUDIX hydrolase [Martelella radicis]MBB4120599.1 8-oxo-dGTP pyrophosphatase MutT (NUDIX family) [Martelella radicis]